MLNQEHPDDERLSELAAGDTDATSDASLSAHITTCDRCAGIVRDVGILRAALADLPDVAPHRPLRLVPPVEASPLSAADRLGQWARRLFAPALTAGAALAMVGVLGTALPALSGMASSGQAGSAPSDGDSLEMAADESAAPAAGSAATEAIPFPSGDAGGGATTGGDMTTEGTDNAAELRADETREADGAETFTAERSPWPMVLFAGVAVMIGALLLRWILVPRAPEGSG